MWECSEVVWIVVRTPMYLTRKWHAVGKRAVISAGSRSRTTLGQGRRCEAHRLPTEYRSSPFPARRTSRALRDELPPIPSTGHGEPSSPPALLAGRTQLPVP